MNAFRLLFLLVISIKLTIKRLIDENLLRYRLINPQKLNLLLMQLQSLLIIKIHFSSKSLAILAKTLRYGWWKILSAEDGNELCHKAPQLMRAQSIKDPAEDTQHLASCLKTHPKTLIIRAYKEANASYFSKRITKLHLYVSYQPLLCDSLASAWESVCIFTGIKK